MQNCNFRKKSHMISMSNNLFASTKWDDKTNSVCVYVDFKRRNGNIVPSI